MRAIAITAALLLPSAAMAQEQPLCLPAEKMRDRLAADFGEHIVSQGILQDGHLHIIFATDDGATWTVVHVVPQTLQACIAAVGTNYQARSPETVEQGL